MSDDAKSPRWDTLHELLTRAEAAGLSTQLSIHGIPTEELLDWLQLGLLDGIEKGAGQNPPTGVLNAGDHLTGRTAAVCFMEDEHERQRRIRRGEDELLAELAGEGSES